MNDMNLLHAIAEGNLEIVKSILVDNPSLVSREALFDAARIGNIDIVRYLVEYSRISLNEYDDHHRNVLHYAAKSGSVDVFRYLVEKCGIDPLEGDQSLKTSWDIVHETKAKEIEGYLEKRYGHRYEDYYRNPVRTGFFPDPSICRVGDDYYMVNSSFIFFPCIPISHSRDLIHWEIIGHAITNPDWAYLDELEGGRGYWAPDISFYEGKFYITATYRLNDVPPIYRRQMVVFSDKPQGPYSKPIFIDEDGIDPSIFNDDDGKRYMLLNRGARIFELDKTGTKKISQAQLLFYGDHKRAPEGPHLYKKDGYYFLLEAEGGTGLGHRVTVSRSKELFGNYEPCPYNPIMRQEDPDAALQRCGHGDLVETQDGRWYMLYLCGRAVGDGYSILGRETALDPVTWTEDGWPIVNNLKGPSAMQVKPFADYISVGQPGISECGLPFDYMTPRPFKKGDVLYDKETGTFSVRGCRAPMSSVDSRNIVLRRQTAFSFVYKITLDIPEMSEGQRAGITGYYDENTYLEFGITSKGGKQYLYANEHIGDDDRYEISEEAIATGAKSLRLKMTTDYLERKLSYCIDGDESEKLFTTLNNVFYLCDEGLSKGKRFTGALVGMYVFAGENDLVVTFYEELYSPRV
jgi:xylan 1,4-beta-xylosidase